MHATALKWQLLLRILLANNNNYVFANVSLSRCVVEIFICEFRSVWVETEIQIPLESFPDSSVSFLIRAGWCEEMASRHQTLAPTFPSIPWMMVTA